MLIWVLTVLVVTLDQLSKFIITKGVALNESIEVMRNCFYLTLVHNTGGAFSIFKNQTLFFIMISIAVIVILTIYIRSKKQIFLLDKIAFACVLGGAFGNLIDRLRLGYVVDFLNFLVWPVFNIADLAITIGTSLLVISLLRKR